MLHLQLCAWTSSQAHFVDSLAAWAVKQPGCQPLGAQHSLPVPDSSPFSPSPPCLAAYLALPRVGCMSSSSLITMLPVACACSLWPSSRLSASPGSMVSMNKGSPQLWSLRLLLGPSSKRWSIAYLGNCFTVQGRPLKPCFGAPGLSWQGLPRSNALGDLLGRYPQHVPMCPCF